MSASYAWTTRDVVTVSGPDAATYLQGQISQDVLGLAIGASASTFVLAPQGKVDGWGRIRRTADDSFAIDVDAGAGDAWQPRLSRFLLRTKAAIAVTPEVATLSVRGAEAPASLADDALPLPGLGAVGFDLVGADAAAVAELPSGAVEVDASDLEPFRIRAGVPAWGSELDGDTIPATVGQWVIDSSVSFTKGCYTGQELVARIDSRGGNVPRHLMGIVIDGPPPAPGTVITVDGAAAGAVTSSALDGERGETVALGFVPRSIEVGAEGTKAEVAGVPARLVALPIT
ncbi:YgfZ/GcvT domain-containing protein [Aquihabitans sp. McL0605]|uniref:CAF17-like 4Fe-4S cluster assembly/insertion protein YgfZ n=1 Tax=Aquihabitans sp. McL0605 TaxID=3415671 RepID=UPI003CEA05AD